MKPVLLCLLSLMFFVSIDAQTRRRHPAPPKPSSPTRSSKKIVETVRTADGREVHLYDDMTYDIPAAIVAPWEPTTIDITIKAGVITRAGDVKPVARQDFIIFKEDIKSTLSGVTDRKGKPLDVFNFWLADQFRELDEGRAYIAALEKLKPIIVGTFTTDFAGNAVIQIPSTDSSYWIYGSSQQVGGAACMWYIEFKPKKNGAFVLDNNNAAYCG